MNSKKKNIIELDHIHVKGAREHNLKNIEIKIPKKKLVVFTGVSGSGKSSLAFDTIFAEGQRRYVESLSSYARQFLGQMEKPKFDTIRGLSPSISIEQKASSKNPRSTVGTITEIYDYLRVLYARVGVQFCHHCGKEVGRGDANSMVQQILQIPEGTKFILMAPIVENRKGEHKDLILSFKTDGFTRVRVDGVLREIDDVQKLARHKKHNIEVIIDRLQIKKGDSFIKRLTDSVEMAVKRGHGQIIIHIIGREDIKMSESRSCCGHAFPELNPPLFSFNSPQGMCPTCNGIGSVISIDPKKIISDPKLTIRQGALIPWAHYFNGEKDHSWGMDIVNALVKKFKINLDIPWNKLSKKDINLILYGKGAEGVELKVLWKAIRSEGSWQHSYDGVINNLMRRFTKAKLDGKNTSVSRFTSTRPCLDCSGKRLKSEVLAVKVTGKSIIDLTQLNVEDAIKFLKGLKLHGNQKLISKELLKEIINRLEFLFNVGLGYLSLDRQGPTLSGGEAQRIRLASQIGSELTGVLYILDEPSIGLHQRDNIKLLKTLYRLRDIGNTLIVVEHDQETIENADWVFDIGPGAGRLGGQIVSAGTPLQLKKDKNSLTGNYLSGKKRIDVPQTRRVVSFEKVNSLNVVGAKENNLKNINVKIPLGVFCCITGVSGAGKSSLINQILYPALDRKINGSSLDLGDVVKIEGLNLIDKVINIDQKPIGKTPRSNPATYTKVYDPIRDIFAMTPDAKLRGYKKGRFSFNVKGGRCENCGGDGHITVEMHFLADVLVPCDVCRTNRFNDSTLDIKFKDHSIADVLNLSVVQALELFENQPKVVKILNTLHDVGLGYIKLGQAATTLSGGEAQRVKLSRELAKRNTGKTLYILDEPTTGLHFEDIKKLLEVLQRLVDRGNTVLVIEHNLDVIKCADWIIDMGPEGGNNGGEIMISGTPETISRSKLGHTGKFLKTILNK